VLESPECYKLREIPQPITPTGMATLQVGACGVCGSDVRYYHGENPWALHTLGREMPNPPNIILGHEFAGRITEVAGDDPAELKGKRVATVCFRVCGHCPNCRKGRPNLCRNTIHMGHGAGWGEMEYYPGAMAEFCPVWGDQCYELPDHLNVEDAAMLDVLTVGMHAARVGEIQPGMTVVSLGAGPVGVSILQCAKALGATRLIATDTYAVALKIAEECGVDLPIDVNRDNPVEVIKENTAGLGADVVFDTVGSLETADQALSVLGDAGTLVILAVHSLDVKLNWLQLGAERRIRTSCNFLPEEFPMTLELLAKGSINVKPWFTHRFPLSEVEKAMQTAVNKKKNGAYKVVVFPD